MIVSDRAAALLLEYVEGRIEERRLRGEAMSHACEYVEQDEPPCYRVAKTDPDDWCVECQQREPLFQAMLVRRRANRKLLNRAERAVLATAKTGPEEPKRLLELMVDMAAGN